MKIKIVFLFALGLFLMMSCKNENTIQQEEITHIEGINTFEIINKSFEEKLNEFIDGCEQINQTRVDAKNYNITVGLITETVDNYEKRTSGKSHKVEVTFMFYVPISCDNIIGMKKIKNYNVFYASFGKEIDKQIIKINEPFNDCLDYADLEIANGIFDPFHMYCVFEKGKLKCADAIEY